MLKNKPAHNKNNNHLCSFVFPGSAEEKKFLKRLTDEHSSDIQVREEQNSEWAALRKIYAYFIQSFVLLLQEIKPM